MIHDHRICQLGEGPLWHPERGELFWFDILGRKLMSATQEWHFSGHASAAGWIDHDHLIVAAQHQLGVLDIDSGRVEPLCPLEPEIPTNRPNDGRADPWGGFWIGTMATTEAKGAGAIYRYYRGELRRLYPGISIPNSICFSPDGLYGYFADTLDQRIMRQRLDDRHGWPVGEPEALIDLRAEGRYPDGSVTDVRGHIWNAQWGSGRIAHYDAAGRLVETFAFPARQTSCPAFGGPDLCTLFCTTAAVGLSPETLAAEPQSGATFAREVESRGRPEARVIP